MFSLKLGFNFIAVCDTSDAMPPTKSHFLCFLAIYWQESGRNARLTFSKGERGRLRASCGSLSHSWEW